MFPASGGCPPPCSCSKSQQPVSGVFCGSCFCQVRLTSRSGLQTLHQPRVLPLDLSLWYIHQALCLCIVVPSIQSVLLVTCEFQKNREVSMQPLELYPVPILGPASKISHVRPFNGVTQTVLLCDPNQGRQKLLIGLTGRLTTRIKPLLSPSTCCIILCRLLVC